MCPCGHQAALLHQTVSQRQTHTSDKSWHLKSRILIYSDRGGGCVDHPAEYTLQSLPNRTSSKVTVCVWFPESWLTGHPVGCINSAELLCNLPGPQLLSAVPMMLNSVQAKAERNDPLLGRDPSMSHSESSHDRAIWKAADIAGEHELAFYPSSMHHGLYLFNSATCLWVFIHSVSVMCAWEKRTCRAHAGYARKASFKIRWGFLIVACGGSEAALNSEYPLLCNTFVTSWAIWPGWYLWLPRSTKSGVQTRAGDVSHWYSRLWPPPPPFLSRIPARKV